MMCSRTQGDQNQFELGWATEGLAMIERVTIGGDQWCRAADVENLESRLRSCRQHHGHTEACPAYISDKPAHELVDEQIRTTSADQAKPRRRARSVRG